MKINPCSCGGTKKPYIEKTTIGCGHFVFCPSCEKTGEIANYKDEAKHKWNEMIKTECRCYKFYKGQNSYKFCPDCGRELG